MSFSFNFIEEAEEAPAIIQEEEASSSTQPKLIDLSLEGVKEVPLVYTSHDIPYLPLTIRGVEFKKCTKHFHSEIDKDVDIISGQYEGGYKSWECCFDLVEYMMQNGGDKGGGGSVVGDNALELGCGVAYPGIYAIQQGYKAVFFSDLNEEVIQDLTWPNIYLNCSSLLGSTTVKCFSGDWLGLSTYLYAM